MNDEQDFDNNPGFAYEGQEVLSEATPAPPPPFPHNPSPALGPASAVGQTMGAMGGGLASGLMAALPWSQPEVAELARLTEAENQVKRDMMNGSLHPQDADRFLSLLAPRLNSLDQKRKKHQADQAAQAEQAAMEQAQKQAAQQEAIRGIHMKSRAENAQQQLHIVLDPLSGKRTLLYPKNDKGDLMPLFEGSQDEEPISLASILPSFKGLPVGAGLEGVGLIPEHQRFEERPRVPNPQGPETLSEFRTRILNGQGEEIGPGNQRVQRDSLGRPTGGGPDQDVPGIPGVSQSQLAEMYRRANSAVPNLPYQSGPHQQLARQQAVDTLVQKQLAHHQMLEQSKEIRKLTQEEHMRAEATRASESREHDRRQSEEHRRQEDARRSGRDEFTLKHQADLIKHYNGEAHKLYKEWATNMANIGQAMPDEIKQLADPKKRKQWVQEQVRDDMEALGMKFSATPAATEPKPPPPAEQNKQALQRIEQVASGADATPSPTDEQWDQPSKVTPRRVEELHDIGKSWQASLKNRSWGGSLLDSLGNEFNPFGPSRKGTLRAADMIDILEKARKEGRGLTNRELKDYEGHRAALAHRQDLAPLMRPEQSPEHHALIRSTFPELAKYGKPEGAAPEKAAQEKPAETPAEPKWDIAASEKRRREREQEKTRSQRADEEAAVHAKIAKLAEYGRKRGISDAAYSNVASAIRLLKKHALGDNFLGQRADPKDVLKGKDLEDYQEALRLAGVE